MSEKQRVPPWDLLEGHKNPAPLSWSWFGAVRIERRPLWYEENHRLLKYHTHSLTKSSSYFLEPLSLPPEDLDPPQEKPVSFMFTFTQTCNSQPLFIYRTSLNWSLFIQKYFKSWKVFACFWFMAWFILLIKVMMVYIFCHRYFTQLF